MAKWQHPDLGVFTFDGIFWTGECTLPAFKAFKFRESARNSGRAKLKLRFETENETEDETPTKNSVRVALKLIKNQERVAARVAKAVWEDLNGKGYDSGMWWHGDLNTVAENVSRAHRGKTQPLSTSDDLHSLLGASSVLIRDTMYLYEKPSATLMFQAAFDTEHGLGVLTDGNRIVGTGYQSSVGPYFEEQITK